MHKKHILFLITIIIINIIASKYFEKTPYKSPFITFSTGKTNREKARSIDIDMQKNATLLFAQSDL